ncbi:MAG: hypothetical protein DWI29_00700 [Planctomycetota bacterium]|nr:MAG: hypothetical protein DWI29_00700 [Planctomycetota bacterium]
MRNSFHCCRTSGASFEVVFSPIIPLILYHGLTSWNTSRTIQEIIKAPSDKECYVPRFDSVLIDLIRQTQLSVASLNCIRRSY